MQVKLRLYKKNDLDIMVLNYFGKNTFTAMIREMLLAFANHEEYTKRLYLYDVNLNDIPEKTSTSFEVSDPLIINLLERVHDKNNFIKQIVRHNTDCELSYYNLINYDKTKDCLHKKTNLKNDDSEKKEDVNNNVKSIKTNKEKNTFFEQKKREKEKKIIEKEISASEILKQEINDTIQNIHNEPIDIKDINKITTQNEPSFDLLDTLLNMTENY